MFNVIRVNDQRRATIALRERKAALLLIIPPDFSASLTAQSPNATLQLIGDTNADSFIFAESLLVKRHEFGAGIAVAPAVPSPTTLPGTGTMSDFDLASAHHRLWPGAARRQHGATPGARIQQRHAALPVDARARPRPLIGATGTNGSRGRHSSRSPLPPRC
ncbi:MAG: hypothetical protein R3E31_10040 [Chloroflexota bacterium]